ncbi:MAG: NUDIX hydrolase [Clostridia bacterium]|nr:NUDIX hydrolase [Clostridia bacterium]
MAFDDLREIPFSSETLYDGKILHVEKWQVTCPNGLTAQREIVVHKGAAAVVPVYEDGTTLLVRQHRIAVDRVTLEIPAGKLDSASEDPLSCAVRELREETGLTAGRMTLLTNLLTTPGFCTEKIAVYLAQDLSQGETHPDEDEFLGLVRMPLEEAVALVMRGEIRDGKTICGLLMAKERLAAAKERA